MNGKVLVASGNPVKINAAKKGFATVFPGNNLVFEGVSADSEVPDQPVGVEETLQGALNRIKNLRKKVLDADYYVGIEGGVWNHSKDRFAFAWIVVEDKNGHVGKAQTGHFPLPPKVILLMDEGYELGDADDMVFGKSNSKQKSGSVGILTNNIIDRTNYYTHAMVLALIPFNKKDIF